MIENEVPAVDEVFGDELFISEPDERNPTVAKIANWSKQGYALVKQDRLAEAKEVFSQILILDEDNHYALVGLGDAERRSNHFLEAINYYERCLRSHPQNNFALFGLADCYKSLNMHNEAIGVWERYLVYDHQNVTVLTRVADSYRKVRNYQKAKALYLQVLEVEEDNGYALIGLGHLSYSFNDYEDALYYWKRVLDVNEDIADIRVLTSIGNCYRKLKAYADGIPYFERSLEHDPRNFYALFGLADCFRGLNQPDRSIEYWNRILALDPKNKVVLTRTGDAYRELGDYEAATDYYNQALDIEFDAYALMGLARISAETGNIDDALARLRRLIMNEPDNYRVYIELANCYLRINRRTEAVAALKEYLAQGVRNQQMSEMIENIEAGIL
jgi:tetratricopeptide (TPR) repeat protein